MTLIRTAFRIGAGPGASGDILIRGNYVNPVSDCSKTAFWFGDIGTMNATLESNRLTVWGGRTSWAVGNGGNTMQLRYNIFDSVWENGVGNRCSGGRSSSGSSPAACCGYPTQAGVWGASAIPGGSAVCNRYESDGSFVEDQWFAGVTHVITGCPDCVP